MKNQDKNFPAFSKERRELRSKWNKEINISWDAYLKSECKK